MKDFPILFATNNLGVEYFEKEELEPALAAFREALELVHAFMQKAYVPNNEHNPYKSAIVSQGTVEVAAGAIGVGPIHITVSDLSLTSPSCINEDMATFVYRRAFLFHMENDDIGADVIPHFDIVCSVILYNLGLCFYSYGTRSIATCACQREMLQLAVQFYCLSLPRCQGGQPSLSSTMHAIILNNLGAAYYHLAEYESMTRVHDSLKLSWNFNMAAPAQQEDSEFLDGFEKLGIMWNMTNLKKPDLAAAA